MKIIGHRGARGLAPENTLAGLAKALEHHVDALEIDVRITKDNVAVLLHNSKAVDASGNKLRVSRATYKELQAHKPDIATLAEAINFVNRRVPLIIELKPHESTEPVIKAVREFLAKGWQPEDIAFISFDFRILRELHTLFPKHLIIIDEMWSSIRATSRARRLGTKHISIWAPALWTGFISALSRRDYKLYGFPTNNAARARKWAKAGFYGAITDYPNRFEKTSKK